MQTTTAVPAFRHIIRADPWQPNGNKKSDSPCSLNNGKNMNTSCQTPIANMFNIALSGASGNKTKNI